MYITLDGVLGIVCLAALLLSHFALTDIYHGGEDLRLEWNILRAAAALFTLFIALTFLTLSKVKKLI